MKKLLLLILFYQFSFSQNGTTEKEFNFLSKGYQETIEKGLDPISGYKIEDVTAKISIVTEENKKIKRISELKKLIRENGEVAALLLIEKRLDNNLISYYCIPNAYSDDYTWSRCRNVFFEKSKNYNCNNIGAVYSYNWNVLQMLSELLTK